MRSNTCQKRSSTRPFFIAAILRSLAIQPELRVRNTLGILITSGCGHCSACLLTRGANYGNTSTLTRGLRSKKKWVRLSERRGFTVEWPFWIEWVPWWCLVSSSSNAFTIDLHPTRCVCCYVILWLCFLLSLLLCSCCPSTLFLCIIDHYVPTWITGLQVNDLAHEC